MEIWLEQVRFEFTDEILDKAEELLAEGLTYGEAAERLGCSQGTLKTTIWKRRNGQHKGRKNIEESKKRDKEIEERIKRGERPSVIARALGMSRAALSMVLRRLGFDKEMRDLYNEAA